MTSLSDVLLLADERSPQRLISPKIQRQGLGSLAKIFRDPQEALFESRIDSLKKLNGVIAFPNRKKESTSVLVNVNNVLKLVKILNQGFKQALRDAEKDVEDSPGLPASRSALRHGRNTVSMLDRSLARYIARGQTLTNAMGRRLERLESAGYIKISDIKDKGDVVKAITGHADKINLSMFDVRMIKSLDDNNLGGRNKERLSKLLAEGYLVRKDNELQITSKFENTVDALIHKGLLDDRDSRTIAGSTERISSLQAQQQTSNDELAKEAQSRKPSPSREISRRLNQDQIDLITTLKQFGNMTESQLHNLYLKNGRGLYFSQDLASLQSKGLLEKERRKVDGLEFNLYNLKYAGNKIGDQIVGHNAQSKSYSKKFTKSDRELIHDLLQYEAAQCVTNDIKTMGGTVEDIIIDRNQRAKLYNNLSIRETGGIEGKFIDVEIHYKDQEGKSQIQYVEVDRGYRPEVISNKSASFPQITWFTDSQRQANRIARHSKSTDRVYLL